MKKRKIKKSVNIIGKYGEGIVSNNYLARRRIGMESMGMFPKPFKGIKCGYTLPPSNINNWA